MARPLSLHYSERIRDHILGAPMGSLLATENHSILAEPEDDIIQGMLAKGAVRRISRSITGDASPPRRR